MTENMGTIIVGGGQAGLSISYYLKKQGREHVVLEQAQQAGEAWRHRWDSFTLITPNWMIRLPGAEYQGDDPDGFMPRDGVIAYLEDYVRRFALPVRYGVRVISVEPIDRGYRVRTEQGDYQAANAVIATGMYQKPKIPPFGTNLPSEIRQLHSSEYKSPAALPAGAVLVVGSAQSGCQIAEELYQSGRTVYLSVGSAGRFPRRYRGKDITRWLDEAFPERTVDQLSSPKAKFAGSVQGTGKDGGHTINLHQFARDGVVLLGHIQSVKGSRIALAPDLQENLARGDKMEAEMVTAIDNYIDKASLDAPTEILPELRDGYEADVILELDLVAEGITTVVWATGYKFDFGLVKVPVTDEDGYPVQKRGVTEYPGLYFVGLPFLHTGGSGLLAGVGADAAYMASAIAASSSS